LQLELPRFKELGASLVAITPETPDNSLTTVEKNNLEFEVLSDVGNMVARQFGIVFTLPEDLRLVYAGFGTNIPKSNGDSTFQLPIPATYVIAHDRKIRRAFVDPDHTNRMDPEDIIDTLEQIANEAGQCAAIRTSRI
jgi:peroxiredoxin